MRVTTGWRSAAALSLVALAACGGDDEVVLVPDVIEKVAATDRQSAPAGALLPQPLAVIVRTSDGTPAIRGEVRWVVSGGTGATLSDSVTQGDGNGRAEVMARLGPTAGSYGVRAEIKGNTNRSVSFGLTATAPPTLASVAPASFGGGDTVTLTGTNLDNTAMVTVAGHPARVLSVQGTTSAQVIMPVCLVPGSVSLRALVRTAASNEITATYVASAAPVKLVVGEYAAIDPLAVAGCAVFPAAGLMDSVEYLMAPQAVTGTAGDSAPYRLRGDSSVVSIAMGQGRQAPGPPPFALAFHDALRAAEAEMARLQRPPVGPRPMLSPQAPAVSMGGRRSFRVCSSLQCRELPDFQQITAEVKYVGEHAAIFQDVTAPAGFSAEEFAQLGAIFDTELYDLATTAFGAESDVDQNVLVFILLTPVVNRLTPKSQCSESFVTGFFHPVDIDPAFKQDQRSNQAEVFYAIVPDPTGSVTCGHTVSAVRTLVPVTFIHEFQHMISYYQRVMLRGGNSSEEVWLNEAMSHLSEELAAHHFRVLGDQRKFSDFAIGDLVNAYKYLKDPGASFTLFKRGNGTLEERGASWLFLRWVVDQFGDGVIRRLSETSLTGERNIAAATGEPVAQLLSQWFFANWVSDLPGFTPQSRLEYKTWNFRTVYADLNRQAPTTFDRPYPLVPDVHLGGDFTVVGVLRAGSGDYFRVIQLPSQRGFALQFTDASGGPLPTAVPTRLNVIRIQ